MRRAFVLLLILATPAHAVELYRCTVKGKTTYQDAPCKDGKVIETETREAIRGYDTQTVDGRSLYILRTQPKGTAQGYVAPTVGHSAADGSTNAVGGECAELKAHAKALRDEARLPQSAAAQDGLRSALRRTEEQIFRLRCG